MRIQHLHLETYQQSIIEKHSLGDSERCRVSVPPQRWDISKMRPVRAPARETSVYKGVKYAVYFDQGENSANFRVKRSASPGKYSGAHSVVVEIRLKDPRVRVKFVQIASCSHDERPSSSRGVVMTNLCGKFFCANPLNEVLLEPVSERTRMDFGCIRNVFTRAGHLSVQQDMQTVFVKGVYDHRLIQQDASMLSGDPSPDLHVYLVVLLGCVGRNLDVSHHYSLLERTIEYRFGSMFSVYPRTEEASNKIEFTNTYNSQFVTSLAEHLDDPAILDTLGGVAHLQDAKIHSTVSRMGEVIFRVSFADPLLLYGSAADAWVKRVCNAHMLFFISVLDGTGWATDC